MNGIKNTLELSNLTAKKNSLFLSKMLVFSNKNKITLELHYPQLKV